VTTPGELPPPVVSPDAYDETYYRECCGGYAEWAASEGSQIAGMYPACLDRAGFRAGEVLVDIGTGRGELLAAAVQRGAAQAIGVEYAEAAVRLAEQTLKAHGVQERAQVLLADARKVPVDDASADLVTLLDVVEHLAPPELDGALLEAHRVLRPDGRILIHTLPNRSIYEITYRWQRRLVPGRRRTWPADPRQTELERTMHVNEQSVSSLRAALRRAGFVDVHVSLGKWIFTDFVPEDRAKRLYRRLAKLGPLARLGVANVWGEGRRR